MIWMWLAAAWAADLSPWAGTWAIDPGRSDDPLQMVERSLRRPLVGATSARGMAADGGTGTDFEEQHRIVRNTVLRMLATSGQLALTPGEGDTLVVAFAAEDPVELDTSSRRWARERTEHGVRRMRARVDEHLVLERREKTIIVTERFLAPTEPGTVPVVVRVDGSGVYAFEFRRVYRSLEPVSTETPAGS